MNILKEVSLTWTSPDTSREVFVKTANVSIAGSGRVNYSIRSIGPTCTRNEFDVMLISDDLRFNNKTKLTR